MPDSVKINVTGIAELQSAFKKIDAELPKAMKAGFVKIAEIVAASARSKVPSYSGRAAASIVAKGQQRGAQIGIGGTKAPYYPWLDFGGSVGRGHVGGQGMSGAIKRTMPDGGRYIYPTIKEHSGTIRRETDALLERLIRQAGFDQKG